MAHRILVIDDEETVPRLMKVLLGREGYVVDIANHPDDASALFAAAKYDLAIVDKNLPGMTGFELVAELRKTDPDLPVILITAYPEPILAGNGQMQGYLAKPFESLKLVSETVRKVIAFNEMLTSSRHLEDEPTCLAIPMPVPG